MTSSRPLRAPGHDGLLRRMVKPTGANMRILLDGNGGLFYEPIIAQSVVAGFINRAVHGLGRGSSLR